MIGRADDPGPGGTRRAGAERGLGSGPALDFVFVPDGAHAGTAAGSDAAGGTVRLRARFVPAGVSAGVSAGMSVGVSSGGTGSGAACRDDGGRGG